MEAGLLTAHECMLGVPSEARHLTTNRQLEPALIDWPPAAYVCTRMWSDEPRNWPSRATCSCARQLRLTHPSHACVRAHAL
eukprot:366551-Chlamydomonas_euryale.AAC.26